MRILYWFVVVGGVQKAAASPQKAVACMNQGVNVRIREPQSKQAAMLSCMQETLGHTLVKLQSLVIHCT